MKMKKLLCTAASVAAAAAAVTAVSAAVSAQVVDFEDGNYSFVTMKTDDGGDLSVLSVEEFNGSKQLKVDVQDCSLLPKVQFDLNAMVGTDNLSDVDKIQMEVTFASKDGTTPPGWIGGALGTSGGDGSPSWNQSDYSDGEYENSVSATILVERSFLLPAHKLVSGTEGTIGLLMRWAAEVPYYMYVDNVRFLDADGNEMDLMIDASAAAQEAPAAETPADASAPAGDTEATAPAKTGNTGAAAIAAVMAAAGAAAVVSKRRLK